MKKIVLGVFLASISFCGFAQKNNVKLGVISLAKMQFAPSYERMITERISLGIHTYFGLPRSGKKALDQLSSQDGTTSSYTDIKYNMIRIMPEVRFYSKKSENGNGFYFSLFGRYSKYNLSGKNNYTDALYGPGTFTVDYDMGVKVAGGGFAIGNQWILKNKITLDVTWIGLGYGAMTLYGKAESTNPNEDWVGLAQDVKTDTDGVGTTTIDINKDSIDIEVKADPAFGVILRLLEFRVGYAF